jgi:DNA-binding transcriptional regulator GbsR (MarR family)
MSAAEGEFVDRLGLAMEQLGGPRTMGRIYAWLLICAPPDQSLTELATVLSVSKASVSSMSRQLLAAGMIERVPTTNRRHRYRVTGSGWTDVLRAQAGSRRLARLSSTSCTRVSAAGRIWEAVLAVWLTVRESRGCKNKGAIG